METRSEVGRSAGVSEARLRVWEAAGLLPRFGSVPAERYVDRVVLLLAARRKLSIQRIRDALAIGGF